MRNFQAKRPFRKFLESWPVLAVLAILAVFFTWQVIGFWSKMENTRKNREIAENKVMELREAKIKLDEDIKDLQTPDGIEENIRNKFGLGKVGEGVIVVVEDKNKATIPEEENDFFSFWKNLFK